MVEAGTEPRRVVVKEARGEGKEAKAAVKARAVSEAEVNCVRDNADGLDAAAATGPTAGATGATGATGVEMA